MSGSATFATARPRLATVATAIRDASTQPARWGAVELSESGATGLRVGPSAAAIRTLPGSRRELRAGAYALLGFSDRECRAGERGPRRQGGRRRPRGDRGGRGEGRGDRPRRRGAGRPHSRPGGGRGRSDQGARRV